MKTLKSVCRTDTTKCMMFCKQRKNDWLNLEGERSIKGVHIDIQTGGPPALSLPMEQFSGETCQAEGVVVRLHGGDSYVTLLTSETTSLYMC